MASEGGTPNTVKGFTTAPGQGSAKQSPGFRASGDITRSTKEAEAEVDPTVWDLVHEHSTEGFDNSLPDLDPYAHNRTRDDFTSAGGPA